jgi:hypothetical protein
VSTTRPLELIHIDLFGPVSTTSLNGKKYGLVIVDDFSRWTWVKFLRLKYDAYDVFSIFCTQIQSEKDLNRAGPEPVQAGPQHWASKFWGPQFFFKSNIHSIG